VRGRKRVNEEHHYRESEKMEIGYEASLKGISEHTFQKRSFASGRMVKRVEPRILFVPLLFANGLFYFRRNEWKK